MLNARLLMVALLSSSAFLADPAAAAPIGGSKPMTVAGTMSCVPTPPPASPINGSCGSANGQVTASAPWTTGAEICSSGSAANGVTTASNFTWTCDGSNGGTSASCSAPRPATAVNGACGSANGTSTVNAPWTTGAQTCSSGVAANGADTGSSYTWTCSGSNGGSNASCSASKAAAPVNAACGTANGVSTTDAPWTTGAQTCSVGSASNGADTGSNYTWTCNGSNGGSNVNCSAPKNAPMSYALVHGAYGPYDYACGPATHSKAVACRRSDNVLVNFSDSNCASLANAYCSSPGPGVACDAIGTGSSFGVVEAVNRGACDSTSGFTGWITGSYGAWSTSCGTATRTRSVQCWDSRNNIQVPDANCAGAKPATSETANMTAGCVVNGACASPPATANAPWDAGHAICSSGTGTNGGSSASTWTWQCAGSNGGVTANCSSSRLTNGVCGSAAGTTAGTSPTANLCSSGSSGTVSEYQGVYSWQCDGANGGTSQSCNAQKAQPYAVGGCYNQYEIKFTYACPNTPQWTGTGTAFETMSMQCQPGYGAPYQMMYQDRSLICGRYPNSSDNQSVCRDCSLPPPPEPVAGTCGSSAGQNLYSAPTTNLCGVGNASAVSDSGTQFTWSCSGFSGGATASCTARHAYVVNGACGSAQGGTYPSAPGSNQCSAGYVYNMYQSGQQWVWTCQGVDGGTNASCSANVTAGALSGVCGPANGTTRATAPSGATTLCSAGAPSAVSGSKSSGWYWSCAGQNGGGTDSCYADSSSACTTC